MQTESAAAAAGKAPPKAVVPLDKRPDFLKICLAGGLITALSGLVNGIALVELGSPPGYTSGTTMNMGRMFGIDGKKFIALWVTYVSGGIFAGLNKIDGDALVEGRPSPGLLLTGLLLALGVIVKKKFDHALAALSIMSFSQGLQNAITSSFSSVPIRSTHTAGGMTDVGVVIGNCLRLISQGQATPALRKSILTAVTVFSFALGGFGSRFAQRNFGLNGILIPAAVVTWLAVKSPLGDRQQDKKDEVDEIVASADVVLFEMMGCPYCAQAEAALKEAGIKFRKVDINTYQPALIEKTGKSSAPSVWIKGTYVGGCNDGTKPWHGVKPLLASGKFQDMLGQ